MTGRAGSTRARRTGRRTDDGVDGGSLPDGPPGDPEQDLGDPESLARAICLQQLTRRARSRSELAAALSKRGVPDEPARRVLDRFTEVGLIDDGELARSVAGAQFRERGLARRAVAGKLRQRGLDDEVIGEAVATIDDDGERARAHELVQRRAAALRGVDKPVQVRRLVGLLARKGYSPGLSYEVVREVLGEIDELVGPAD